MRIFASAASGELTDGRGVRCLRRGTPRNVEHGNEVELPMLRLAFVKRLLFKLRYGNAV